MKIYTRTGDQGKTKLLSGQSIEKSDQRLNVYGTTDELNSWLGVCKCSMGPEWQATMTQIQNELFNVGSLVACDDPAFFPKLPSISQSAIDRLEQKIDEMTLELPPLKNFILPAGSLASSQIHVARTVCRRAEREFSLLKNLDPALRENQNSTLTGNQAHALKENLDPALNLVGVYLNRLSDYLFVLARYLNFKAKIQDVEWQK